MTAAVDVQFTDIVTTNPATGRELGRYTIMSAQAVDDAVAAADAARRHWAGVALSTRIETLLSLADVLERRRDELAALMIDEVGKPRREALGEIDKCARTCRYFADDGAAAFETEIVPGPGRRNEVVLEPIGTVLAIMPWNFPFWQVIRCAVPAMTIGNAVLLKHSPNSTGCALAIQEAFGAAGYPSGIFQTLVIDEPRVPDVVGRLVEHPLVHGVALTGSSRAGSAVAAQAGRALKKSVLELGGSDPFVVLDDADLEATVAAAVASRFVNCGQSCLAAKRLIVHQDVATEFTERFVAATNALVVGDPHDEQTQIGPMARRDLRDTLVAQLAASTAAGARIVAGGHALDRPGSWFAPTVLVDVTDDMSVMTEETFGPLAPIITAADDDEAVELANDTVYGLGASVWSADVDRARLVGGRIRSGALFVNAVVASDPRLPFGGVGRSGYGRELGSLGAREFANVRTVVIGGS